MNFAYLFPGQGSQSIGMLVDLAANFSEVKQVFELGSDILRQDLWKLVSSGPENELNQTENTQPVMLCANFAIWMIWQRHFTPLPRVTAGHSFGEYSALVCARALTFEAALPVARYRGRVMQQVVPRGQGAMAAIVGLDDENLVEVCRQSAQGQVVEAVNFNAPGQTVIAGHSEAVARAVSEAKYAGARRAITLPLSVPAHSTLMQPAAERLRDYLHDVPMQPPQVDVIQNADVRAYSDVQKIKDALYRQLFNPVPWIKTVQSIISLGVDALIELGPGKVITGLNRRIDRTLSCYCIYDSNSFEQTLASIEKFIHKAVE